jgi:hypothetical protein
MSSHVVTEMNVAVQVAVAAGSPFINPSQTSFSTCLPMLIIPADPYDNMCILRSALVSTFIL